MTAYRYLLVLLFTGIIGLAAPAATAGVLPDDRADTLYHYYDGGGVKIDGPSILVRKSIKDRVSVYGNYYVDRISSASIDVVTSGASAYTEERDEYSVGVDFLNGDTLMSMGFTSSSERDYKAQSLNIGIAQEIFGGMTTVTMGYGRGADDVYRNGPDGQPDGIFADEADRRNYRLGLSQVVTRNMLLGINYEAITDEGFLNNPYRQVRYADGGSATGYAFEAEVYPRTRSSNAVALRTRYYLPYRAAVQAGYRFFADSWGIDAHNVDVGYTHPLGPAWVFDLSYRFYTQSAADFYSDLFPYQGAQNFLARDKELSTFDSHTIRFGVSYDLIADGWGFFDKATVNLHYDHILYDYSDFRDLRAVDSGGAPLYATGTEPMYSYASDVLQLYFSVWF